MTFHLARICRWLDLACSQPGPKVRGYSIDSRTLRRGDLFFALRGPRNDGHKHVGEAFRKGAVAAVVEQGWHGAGQDPLLRVTDTARTLREVAARARRAWGGTVVAVTGSGGKTTTKDITADLLSAVQPAAKSEGNLNNKYGLPLSLLRIPDGTRTAVVEIGINHAGEMQPLATLAAPDIGVVTNVGTAHLGNFTSIDEIGQEKGRLIEALAPSGTAVLNADDVRVSRFARLHSGRTVTFGIDQPADMRADRVRDLGADGTRFRVAGEDLASALPGRHNIYNVLAALAVAHCLDISPARLRDAVARLQPSAMRGCVRRSGGVTVIDDCYNANPSAMTAMLDVLARTSAARRIAVLGEMRELGERSRELHREVGAAVASSGVDFLITVGGDAAAMAESAGVPAVIHETPDAAAGFLADFVRAGDAVLIKASRGVALERVRDPLLRALGRSDARGAIG